ncbi:MAG: M14 family metallopeptidase [Planctomycetota bacterium]
MRHVRLEVIALCSLVVLMLAGQGIGQTTIDRKSTSGTVSGEPARSTRLVSSRFWDEDTPFNEAIPTPEEYFGFEVGVRHLDHARVVDYIEHVVELSDRLSLKRYAVSHGNRPLLMVTITSPENHQRLDRIKRDHRSLANPSDRAVDLDDLPAVINMGYGVHGDESSATNCTPLVVYYLAAAESDEVKNWLDQCVILLDPSLNPDGFNRFANWANRYRGSVVNPDPQHAEHNQMWPPGRVNYYWFDLNRDWLPAVHPESRGRLRNFHQWKPNVVLDFHEMGTGSTYFFQPGIPERTNPLTPKRNQQLTGKFAQFHSKKLDQQGSLYFTQERFDDFYMGKGSTYPDLHGSVGILFEQASSRGHVQKTATGLLAFHDTIKNQFTTSLTSLQATTAMRKTLLEYKRDFYRESLELAKKSTIQTYLFSIEGNSTRLENFATLLARHDIDCYALKDDFDYGDQTFRAKSTLVVPVDQPEFRFLKSLLMRRTRFRENIFYDVSSWTLPLAYGINQKGIKKPIDSERLEPFEFPTSQSKPVNPKQTSFTFDPKAVGYAIDYRDDAACKMLIRLLRANIQVRVALKPFQISAGQGKKKFDRGSIVVLLANQDQKHKQIERILTEASPNLRIAKVSSGLSASGPDMGSSNFSLIKKPRIAMLTGRSISSYGAGEIWHYLDHELRMPVSLIKENQLSRSKLSDYTTLILPDGSISSENWETISSYAKQGGNVVVIGRQSISVQRRLRSDKDAGSESGSGQTDADNAKQSGKGNAEDKDRIGSMQSPFDSASNKRALQLISGAIFKTKADLTHPLMYGFSYGDLPVFRNHASFLKPSTSVYRNPLVYDDQPLMAGYCSDENIEKFSSSASVVVENHGRGQIILMADNPNFRGFWQATRRVFLNGVLWGEKTRVN